MTDRPARNLDAPTPEPDSDKHERPTVRPPAKIQSFVRETSATDSERGFLAEPMTQRRSKASEAQEPRANPGRIVTAHCSARPDKTHPTIDDSVRVPVVIRLPVPTDSLPVDHRTDFLLSLIDGSANLEALVDRCGIPKSDALRILYELMERGIIAFG
jgi:hypothetical protein